MALYCLLGLNTLDLLVVGSEKSPARSWSLMDHRGPLLSLFGLGYPRGVYAMMPKDLLETLYERLSALNPKGTVLTVGEQYWEYVPQGMSEEEALRLAEEGKLFQNIADDGNYCPRLREIMPELTQPEVLERLASDLSLAPWLLKQALSEEALSPVYGSRHWRWWPEWEAYVDAYKKAHPAQ